MEFTNKKLLILGGAYLHKKVVEAAREMGIYTIVTDNVPGAPAKAAADKYYDINVSDVDALEEMCRREQVDAVLNVCLDFCQNYYQQLCQRLDLPCYGTKEQFDCFTNKELFKALCQKNGVSIIPSYTPGDVLESRVPVEYPILIKPSRAGGSKGQSVCHNREEAILGIALAREASANGQVIIEKYMGGKDDFQVTYLVIGGQPYVVRTADRYLGSREDQMDRVAIALSSPSSNTALYYEKVHANVCRMFRDIGLKDTPVFMQGFVDGDTIRFYDPGLRFPGGEYDRVFADVMGTNMMKMLVELSFTGKLRNENDAINADTVHLKDHIIFTLHSTIREGTIRSITPAEKLLSIPGVCYLAFRHHVGETIPFTGNVNQRIAEFNVCSADPASLRSTVRQLEDTLVVLDEDGKDMVFSKFDITQWREYRRNLT